MPDRPRTWVVTVPKPAPAEMRTTEMSTETTSDLFRRAADAWVGDTASDDDVRRELRARADRLEREQRPLPDVPGLYSTIVVEQDEEECTGAMLMDDGNWMTPVPVGGVYDHFPQLNDVTIRWAEQDDPTPGQTVREAASAEGQEWPTNDPFVKDQIERITAAVLAAYTAPTLTPVGEHPAQGTRGLLPVVVDEGYYRSTVGGRMYLCEPDTIIGHSVLADPRPDGAL